MIEKKDGWETRLRCGGAERERILIKIKRKLDAEAREVRLKVVRNALVRGGVKPKEIVVILTRVAEQETEPSFAKMEAEALAQANAPAPVPVAPRAIADTFEELAGLWTSGALHERFKNKVDSIDPETARKHINKLRLISKTIGGMALSKITEADADKAIAALPKMRKNTRIQYESVLRRVMKIAAILGLIKVSPLPLGWVEKPDPRRAMAFIYPPEDAQLMACAEILFWRRLLWGFLVREGCRIGEAAALVWKDFDLVRGTVRLDKNKTRVPRKWTLSPGVLAAVRVWFFECQRAGKAGPGMCVFPSFPLKEAAAMLREDFKAAGLTDRPELFEHNDERCQLHAHDTRGTFITLAFANNRAERWIMNRTGHKTSKQLHEYDRESSLAEELGFVHFFTPLAEALGLGGVADNDGVGAMDDDEEGPMEDEDRDDSAGEPGGLEAPADGRVPVRYALSGDADGVGRVPAARRAASDRSPGMARTAGRRTAEMTPGVGQGMGQLSRTGTNHAGHGGLPQTPGDDLGLPGECNSADLATPGDAEKHAGPPGLGGVGQTSPGQTGAVPDKETSLAMAIANASEKEQWGVVEMLGGLLKSMQHERRQALSPDVPSIDKARARKGAK